MLYFIALLSQAFCFCFFFNSKKIATISYIIFFVFSGFLFHFGEKRDEPGENLQKISTILSIFP